jgi:hypothetical protein
MSVSIITKKVDARTVTLKLVDGSLIHGKVNLHRGDADVQRVSDIFTKGTDPFIVVFDATVENKSGRVLILNKRNIVWIAPEEEIQQKQDKPLQEEEKLREIAGGSWLDRLRSI